MVINTATSKVLTWLQSTKQGSADNYKSMCVISKSNKNNSLHTVVITNCWLKMINIYIYIYRKNNNEKMANVCKKKGHYGIDEIPFEQHDNSTW